MVLEVVLVKGVGAYEVKRSGGRDWNSLLLLRCIEDFSGKCHVLRIPTEKS